MLPVLSGREVDLEVVVTHIETIDATSFADLDHLSNWDIASFLVDFELDFLAHFTRELSAVESELAAAGNYLEDRLLFFVENFELG